MNSYQIAYGSSGQNTLVIYYKDKQISGLDRDGLKLYQDNSCLLYINQEDIYFNKKENIIKYTNSTKVFSYFGSNSIDGIYNLTNQKNKNPSSLLGDKIIPKQLFYKNKECKIITSDIIACCVVGSKKEAIHLGIND